MKEIIKALPREQNIVEIHTLADEHYGDANCDVENLKHKIEYIKNTPNAYVILNGDILDMAVRDSIGDVEARTCNIMQSIEAGVTLLEPIKDRILSITTGNHENRVYRRDGIDITKLIAAQMGLTDLYSPTSCLIYLSVGNGISKNHNRQMCYTIYHLHGCGGGRKEGAKAIRLADMACIIDADVYIHSHTHLPMIQKQGYHRVDTHHKTTSNVTKLFVNTASNLSYGGYGEAQEFKPNSKDTPVVYLCGDHRYTYAKL